MAAVDENKRKAAQLCAQARNVRTQARVLAEVTVATQDQVAATIDRLADQRPYQAERLRAISETARRYAARERQRLIHEPGGGTCRCAQGHVPAAGWPVPGPAPMPEAAPITTTPDHHGELPVIEERDRIAAQLLETVVRRVFAAGLSLQSAAGLTAEPEVCWRIEAAVDELDQVIREIRTVVFQDVQDRHGRTLSQDIADLSGQLGTTASIRVSDPAGSAMPAGDSARLLVILRQLLGLIGEHATPANVDITADASSYGLIIEATPLSPGASAAEPASWFSSVQAIAAQAGVGLAVEPVPGGTRFTCQLPIGLRR